MYAGNLSKKNKWIKHVTCTIPHRINPSHKMPEPKTHLSTWVSVVTLSLPISSIFHNKYYFLGISSLQHQCFKTSRISFSFPLVIACISLQQVHIWSFANSHCRIPNPICGCRYKKWDKHLELLFFFAPVLNILCLSLGGN